MSFSTQRFSRCDRAHTRQFSSSSAFTLVELIIVITILAILGLVAFLMMSDATVSARDSNRLASIKNIYDASQLQAVQQRILPLPDQAITLTVSGTDIGWQGYMSGYVAQAYGYSDSVYDPQDRTPYIYRLGQARDKSQYLAYLENGGSISQGDILVAQSHFSPFFPFFPSLDSAHAADFSKRVPYVYGDRLGIVLSNTTNEPANALIYDQNTNTGTLDLGGNTIDTNYSIYVNESLKLSSVEGTGATALKTNDGLDDLLAGATIVASNGSSGGSSSGTGSNDPTCGLTNQEVIDLNAVKGESYTAEDWCAMTSINWSNSSLTELPSGIVKLTSLENLNLTTNALTTLPNGFSALIHLHDLNLYENNFTEVPNVLASMTGLTYLDFSYNQISVIPEFIGNLTNLTGLSFWHNTDISTIPDSLENLTNLTYLDFDENVLLGNLGTWWSVPNHYNDYTQSNITPLGQTVSISASSASPYIQIQIGPSPPPPPFSCTLTSEEVIALNDIETTFYGEGSGGDPKTLQEWCDTQILGWGNRGLDENTLPTSLQKIPNLQEVYLSSNHFTLVPNWITTMTGVSLLDISSNDITVLTGSIGNMTQLTNLYIGGNQLTSLPPEIGNLSNLIGLYGEYSQLESLPAEIGDLSHLEILRLGYNQLTSLPPEIGNLSNLRGLFLDSNQLTSLPPEIGNLVNLTNLSANSNQIFNSLPNSIGNLSALQQLDLGYNQIPNLPESISNLTNLISFNASNNLITNIPQNIGNLTLLIELSLDYNHITIVPASFGNLVSLNAVNLSHNLITSFEDDLANLGNVEIFNVSYNSLASLPNFTGPMNNLWWVILDHNNLTGLPESIYNQHILRISARDNSLSTLPDSLVWFNNSYLHLYLSGNNLLGGLNQDFEPPSYFVGAANNITPTGKRLYIQSGYGKFWIQN